MPAWAHRFEGPTAEEALKDPWFRGDIKKPPEETDDNVSGLFNKSFITNSSKQSRNSAVVSVSSDNSPAQIESSLLPVVGKCLINLCRFDRSTFKLKDIIFTYVVSQIMTLE